ncbi:MAG: ABC transporter ATP-binding protein [Clostridiales bacterium]|nr:ABC transporter ATP-binding protein [Candidatus Blautia equi]
MKLMIQRVRSHLWMFLTAIFFLSVESGADLLQPMMMSWIVDRGVKQEDVQLILKYGVWMLGIAFLGAIGAVMRNIYASKTSQLIGMEIRSDLYRKIQTLSFENIDRLQPASLITRITNDVTQMQNFINGCMRIMVKAPITCVGAILMIIIQTPQLIPVMVVILAIAACLIAGNMKLGYPRFQRLQKKLDRINDVSREFLSSIRVVKAFGGEDQEQEKFDSAADDLAAAGMSATRVMAVFGPLINLTVNLGIVFLLLLSGYKGTIPIGKVMASVNYMTQVLFALGMVSNILNMAVRATASADRIQEVLEEEPAQKSAADPLVKEIVGDICFKDVSFTYAGAGRPSVMDMNLEIHAGETIGIIGATGSGKTTLINLVPRFYDVSAGELLIDGVNVNLMEEHALREAIAVVPQKALLFSGTIGYNLRWGKEDASEEEVKRAAEAACAEEFIQRQEKGYDTLLGQGGVNLSGGQKQRLSLARALLRHPKILILDDCTSALDAYTEAKVLKGLREHSKDMTVLLISQRISTVRRADHILCMENGRAVGYGSHEELMENCRLYQDIFRSQIGGEDNG